MNRVVIVGGSIGGMTTATTLRALGHAGEIVIIDSDTDSYPRPSLSKAALRGESVVDGPWIDPDMTLLRPTRVTQHDPDHRLLTLSDGEKMNYSKLVIATGSRAAVLTGTNTGQLVLRSLADVGRLRARFTGARSAIVVGGGLLGIEIASAARESGLDVRLVCRRTPGMRSIGSHTARWIAAEARAHGVHIVSTRGVEALVGSPATGARLEDGRTLEADVVITALGDVPDVDWTPLGIAGIGVPADKDGWVTPDVLAVGDAKATRTSDGYTRDPHYYAAMDSGRAAAAAIMGSDPPTRRARYLWTECFGHHIKIAGTPVDGPPTRIVEGDTDGPHIAEWDVAGRTVFATATDMKIPVPRLRARVATT